MANHITTLRQKAGINTAEKASRLLEISRGMMYQVEEGYKKPSLNLGIKMTKVFGCTLDAIFLPYDTTNSDKKPPDAKEVIANDSR